MGCSIKNIFTNRTCVPLLKVQVALRLEMYRPPRIISESIRQSPIRYHIIKVSRRGLGILKESERERERAFDAMAKSNYLPVPMHALIPERRKCK